MATRAVRGPDCTEKEITREGVDYRIRPYEEGDAPGVCALLNEESTAADWDVERFQRTYGDNPYLDHVPLLVAEQDDDIVGARPFTAFRVRAGDATAVALLTRDTLVHADHRRRGLFTEMTKLAIEHYEAGDPAFVFSHSNRKSRPGYEKMGWSYVGHRETYCRVQRADALIAAKTRDLVTSLLTPVATPLSAAYLGVREWTSPSPDGLAVTRRSTVPAQTMASLYDRQRPDGLHVVRDEAFYRWRFRNPEWEPNIAFIARRDGEPVAGLATVEYDGPFTTTSVVDVVPRTGGEKWADAVGGLLDSVVDHASSDVVLVREPVVPRRVLGNRGFLSSSRLPLSLLVNDEKRLSLGIRALETNGTTLDGHRVGNAESELWSVAH